MHMSDIEPAYIKILIVVATLCGLIVATHIRKKKVKKEVLVCPLNSDCEAVVHSEYSKFLNLPVEVLGIAYYAVFLVIYSITLFWLPANNILEGILIAASSIAALFSLYLVSIQAFVIKQWCFWCLLSFFASLSIFILFVLL